MSESFEKAWIATGRAEGGYSNHPSDPGGETMWGITARVARSRGYGGAMIDLPKETAREIAKLEYWDPLMLDQIAALSEAIALELFDTHFNFYWGAAGKFLQRALNKFNRRGLDYDDIAEDGEIGPRTVYALECYLAKRGYQNGEKILLSALNCQQGADYLRQAEVHPEKEDFMFGWFAQRIA